MIRRLTPFLRSYTVYPQQLSSLLPHFKLHKFPFSFSSASSSSEMAATNNASSIHWRSSSNKMKKLVVIMGPTGSGKSKLSIDLATRFFPNSEIINSDKIQVYKGLDITTNKISMQERRGVPHHFLGEFDPETEITPSGFRSLAPKTIAQIIARRNLPLLVGGSNSFIHALLARRFITAADVFDPVNPVSSELRYDCCFIWVDVSPPVLNRYLYERVDEMLDSGMFEELSEYFGAERFDGSEQECRVGLRKAIGVPEFERYFRRKAVGGSSDVEGEEYEGAVKAVKDNTCKLAKRQLWKIKRLREAGWDLQRVDATEAFRAAMMASDAGERAPEIWEKMVVEPSVKIVNRFLME